MKKLRALIDNRRRYRGAEIDPAILEEASPGELFRLAMLKSTARPSSKSHLVTQRSRQRVVKMYALKRADGKCEFCKAEAPFRTDKDAPYLECHHITELANEGADHPGHVIAVCPNCHRRAHHSHDRDDVKRRMKKRVAGIQRKAEREFGR